MATILVLASTLASCASDAHHHHQLAALGWAPVTDRGPGSGPWQAASPEAHGLSTAKLMVRSPVRVPWNSSHPSAL